MIISTEQKSSLNMAYHLTQRANLQSTRYGWLRLTPAYSVNLVSELLEQNDHTNPVLLDPFCGTGTTALVASERGIECDTTDINPFLLWLTGVKVSKYCREDIETLRAASSEIVNAMKSIQGFEGWVPPIHQIEKWWDIDTLDILSRVMDAIKRLDNNITQPVSDLLRIAFCRIMISSANVSFGHQSMSFKRNSTSQCSLLEPDTSDILVDNWIKSIDSVALSAESLIITQPMAILSDARTLSNSLPLERYTCVITSPPYPNRMSYIRELRPYMYWLGYLTNGRDAGEMDWQAIGGTWGCATSNLGKWKPERDIPIPFQEFEDIVSQIHSTSPILAQYVHKYFVDMISHSDELLRVVRSGGTINYIVGNSKFYDVVLPVERIFGAIFESAGFIDVNIRKIRKRSSKKELFEFIVSARKP